MKEKYYQYYDKNAEPRVDVCLVFDTDTGSYARGISVCSYQDEYNEEEGKFIAKRNAERILKGRTVDPFNTKEVIKILVDCQVPWTEKAELNPDLAFFEEKMLFGNKIFYDLYNL